MLSFSGISYWVSVLWLCLPGLLLHSLAIFWEPLYAWVSPCPRERATHSRRERYSEDVWLASVLFWDRAPTVRPFTLWRPFHSGHHEPPVAPPTFTLWRAAHAAPFDRNTTPVLPAIASYSPLWDQVRCELVQLPWRQLPIAEGSGPLLLCPTTPWAGFY